MTRENRMSALKTLPGLLISAFFLWWTWLCESLLYLSAMRMIGLETAAGALLDWGAPMQTVSLANFAFLVPSAPGGIGPFEWACQKCPKASRCAVFLGRIVWASYSPVAASVNYRGWRRDVPCASAASVARRKPLLEEIRRCRRSSHRDGITV